MLPIYITYNIIYEDYIYLISPIKLSIKIIFKGIFVGNFWLTFYCKVLDKNLIEYDSVFYCPLVK
jgi:hypothetical protein